MAIEEQRTGTPVAERRHRVHGFAGRAHQVLDELLGVDGSGFVSVAELGVTATKESLVELTALQDRIGALVGKLLDHGEILTIGTAADEDGQPPAVPAPSTAAWYAEATRVTPTEAKAAVRVGKRVEDFFHATGRALAAGRINTDHAKVIVDAVDALPDFVLEAERLEAERVLLVEATRLPARDLKRVGTRLLEVIDPDGLDDYLAAKLAEEEHRAARRCFLSLHDDGHGTVHGRFALPGLNADMLSVALNAIASPKRPDAIDRTDDAGDKPTAEVLGLAFCEYIERYPTDKLPLAGGINASVVVTMTLQSLLGGLTPATLDTGRQITAGQARRLASQAGVIPAVLGSHSEVLDLGRKVRLHTAAQRTALRIRHQTCTVEGCTVPAAWCHAHHKTPWAHGGPTSIHDGTLICPRHHRALHRPGYTATYTDDGVTRIIRTVKRRQ